MSRTSLAPEAVEGVHAAVQELQTQADRLAATGDPIAAAMAASTAAVRAGARLLTDASLTWQVQLEALTHRPLVAGDDVSRGVRQAVAAHMSGFVRALNVRNVLLGVALGIGLVLAGAVGGYLFRGAAPALVGVRAGAEQCQDRPDGSRLCWIPVFERVPR